MSSPVALILGGTSVYWSGIIIAVGIGAGFLLTYALYTAHSGRGECLWMVFALSLLIGLIFSRLVHFFYNREQYRGLVSALSDFSRGSFWLPGAAAAVIPAAILTSRMYMHDDSRELLDACAPGLAFAVAMIRLSALFNTTCRSSIPVREKWMQRYPFASLTVDAVGNRSWHFATFFVMAILMLAVMLGMLAFYIRHHADRMRSPCPRSGNVAILTMTLICAAEFVMDSTRSDPTTISFRFLQFLNPAASFISLTQIVCAGGLIFAICYYGRYALQAEDKDQRVIPLFVLFGISFVFGGITEYLVQRYTGHPALLYSLQGACALLMAFSVWAAYYLCRERAQKDDPRPSGDD